MILTLFVYFFFMYIFSNQFRKFLLFMFIFLISLVYFFFMFFFSLVQSGQWRRCFIPFFLQVHAFNICYLVTEVCKCKCMFYDNSFKHVVQACCSSMFSSMLFKHVVQACC